MAFRDKQNRLYRNDGDHFTEVGQQMGLTGAHSTVAAVWLDYNEDGRLDLFEANQSGVEFVCCGRSLPEAEEGGAV